MELANLHLRLNPASGGTTGIPLKPRYVGYRSRGFGDTGWMDDMDIGSIGLARFKANCLLIC